MRYGIGTLAVSEKGEGVGSVCAQAGGQAGGVTRACLSAVRGRLGAGPAWQRQRQQQPARWARHTRPGSRYRQCRAAPVCARDGGGRERALPLRGRRGRGAGRVPAQHERRQAQGAARRAAQGARYAGVQTVFARCSARPVCRRAGREARAARHVRRGHQRRCLPHSAAACTGARLLRGGQRRGARRD